MSVAENCQVVLSSGENREVEAGGCPGWCDLDDSAAGSSRGRVADARECLGVCCGEWSGSVIPETRGAKRQSPPEAGLLSRGSGITGLLLRVHGR
jgi:hypothetical protein